MKRSFKNLKPEDLELLVSRDTSNHKKSAITASVKFHIFLFAVGVLGSMGCLWAMFFTSHSEEVANNLGMQRFANSLENILQLLEYPFLMFTIILAVYAAQQLYRAYAEASNPSYRGSRR